MAKFPIEQNNDIIVEKIVKNNEKNLFDIIQVIKSRRSPAKDGMTTSQINRYLEESLNKKIPKNTRATFNS